MKITIIGWYGTETLGDRAILAGIISLLVKRYSHIKINLGSLYPFFTERTINEDYSFYQQISSQNIEIDIFNSKNSIQLKKAIQNSELIIMGGGPLMDLNELFMIEYAFKKAKALRKKTALIGCGIGPLFQRKFKKSVLEIVKNSDKVILRDSLSMGNLESISREFNYPLEIEKISISVDPSIEAIVCYCSTLSEAVRENYIAVNLRSFPAEYSQQQLALSINKSLQKFVLHLADKFSDREIKLLPMHYFHIGGDDRVFLNQIAQSDNTDNIYVQNQPLSLQQTIENYRDAYFNIGMRFHSVVFQSIASGFNAILDYTQPDVGKISGFIKDIDSEGFYEDRYNSLQQGEIDNNIISNITDKFEYNKSLLTTKLSVYSDVLNQF
jgi:polysaccharide pyruvyl transferase WcaK-like protein